MAVRGINKVILVGRLGKDPEVRYIPNGGAVANLQVATSESWRDKQTGEIREQTEWHRVVLFGKLAEVAGEYPHVQPDRQYHALLPVYFFLDTRWSGFMDKNKLADVCERLYLLVVYHAGRHAGFNQIPAGL